MLQETNDELEAENAFTQEENGLLKEENAMLREENARLNSICCKCIVTLKQGMITLESLKENNAKVKYYTGLPSYSVLKAIFNFVSPCLQSSSRKGLPLFSQFLMVRTRLRLNLDIDHLSYQFGIHSSNVSRTVRKWINVMYERLKPLIIWPEHEELYKTMPIAFKKFGKCIVIIDCFEIFMERPST